MTSRQQALDRLTRLAPGLATWLLTAVIAWQCAGLVWLLLPQPLESTDPSAISLPSDATANKPFTIAALLDAKLFGDPQAQDEPEEQLAEDIDAPETNLRIKLRGIVAMEDSGLSRALIEASNGDVKPYAVGMDVTSDASLHSIYPDRVLLKRGGRLETLRLEKEDGLQSRTAANDSRSDQGAAAQILDSGTAAKLSNIRNELLNDPTKASRYLRVQPARSNGVMKGYRIYPGRRRDLFREAGLRPGDIVTSINGVALDDPSRSFQLLGDLSSAQQINLQIERGGQTQSLSVTLN